MARLAGYLDGAGPEVLGAMMRAMACAPGASARPAGGGIACSDSANGWIDDGRVVVAFDGRLYNPEDFPPDGAAAGDAARIAAAYRGLGFERALARTNGDFALALLDRDTGELYLARDRFGVKPLYYADRAPLFAFASRPAGLFPLARVDVTPRPDYVATFAAGHYRLFDNPPARTPYAGIAQLPAACYLRRKGGRATVHRYYMPSGDETGGDLDQIADAYRALFLDAVGRRLARARRPGFTLSGGMDSSSVAACAAQLGGQAPLALSTTYGGADYDESADIAPMVEAGLVCWQPVPVECPDVFALVAQLTPLHDQPLSTATWLSHYLLCKAARAQGVETLFGGLGGDEQHAGEYDYFFYFFADLLAAGETDRHAAEVAAWRRHHDHPVWRKTAAVAEARRLALTDPDTPGRCRADRRLLTRYAAALDPGVFDLGGLEPELDHAYGSYLHSHAYNEIYRETMPCCLRASDRNAAAFGLADALPFFDHRLVDVMFAVPGALKIRDGVTKQVLRHAMRGLLPEQTRTRVAKTGWNAPMHRWFAADLRAPLLDLVRSRRFRERGIYRPQVVERLIDEHVEIVTGGAARDNHMMFLWQLVSLEGWLAWLDQLSARVGAEAR